MPKWYAAADVGISRQILGSIVLVRNKLLRGFVERQFKRHCWHTAFLDCPIAGQGNGNGYAVPSFRNTQQGIRVAIKIEIVCILTLLLDTVSHSSYPGIAMDPILSQVSDGRGEELTRIVCYVESIHTRFICEAPGGSLVGCAGDKEERDHHVASKSDTHRFIQFRSTYANTIWLHSSTELSMPMASYHGIVWNPFRRSSVQGL